MHVANNLTKFDLNSSRLIEFITRMCVKLRMFATDQRHRGEVVKDFVQVANLCAVLSVIFAARMLNCGANGAGAYMQGGFPQQRLMQCCAFSQCRSFGRLDLNADSACFETLKPSSNSSLADFDVATRGSNGVLK